MIRTYAVFAYRPEDDRTPVHLGFMRTDEKENLFVEAKRSLIEEDWTSEVTIQIVEVGGDYNETEIFTDIHDCMEHLQADGRLTQNGDTVTRQLACYQCGRTWLKVWSDPEIVKTDSQLMEDLGEK